MTQQKRKVVFQSAEEEEEIKIDPPLKPAEDEDLDDLVGDETPEQAPVVEEPPPVIEQKELAGWKLIGPEQHTGNHYIVTHDIHADGVMAYWRKTRVLSHFRWVLNGRWSKVNTKIDIIPPPVYFKEVE